MHCLCIYFCFDAFWNLTKKECFVLNGNHSRVTDFSTDMQNIRIKHGINNQGEEIKNIRYLLPPNLD